MATVVGEPQHPRRRSSRQPSRANTPAGNPRQIDVDRRGAELGMTIRLAGDPLHTSIQRHKRLGVGRFEHRRDGREGDGDENECQGRALRSAPTFARVTGIQFI